jgi:hypothetical protein
MNTLAKFKKDGFTFTLNDSGFNVKPSGRLTDEQRQFIKSHKAEIMQDLREEQLIIKWLASTGADSEEVDDVLNRCRSDLEAREYFLSRSAKRGNVIPFPVKKGFTRCYTPNGNPIDVEPTSPEHAAFLRKMNPKPETNHD